MTPTKGDPLVRGHDHRLLRTLRGSHGTSRGCRDHRVRSATLPKDGAGAGRPIDYIADFTTRLRLSRSLSRGAANALCGAASYFPHPRVSRGSARLTAGCFQRVATLGGKTFGRGISPNILDWHPWLQPMHVILIGSRVNEVAYILKGVAAAGSDLAFKRRPPIRPSRPRGSYPRPSRRS